MMEPQLILLFIFIFSREHKTIYVFSVLMEFKSSPHDRLASLMLLHLCEICLSLVDGSSNYDIEIQLATSDFPPKFIFSKLFPGKASKLKATGQLMIQPSFPGLTLGQSDMAGLVEQERMAQAEVFVNIKCQEMEMILHDQTCIPLGTV